MHESGSVMAHTGPLPTPSIALQASVIASAHAHNKITRAHALSMKDTLAVLEAGTDGLAHCFCDEMPTKELVEAYKKHDSFLIPTLIVVATLTGEEVCLDLSFLGVLAATIPEHGCIPKTI